MYIFTYLAVSGLHCSIQTLGCGIWDLVSYPGIELRAPALGTQSLSHWTTKEVPEILIFFKKISITLKKKIKHSLYLTLCIQ